MDVEAKLKTIPDKPGVYMMKAGKTILYIGKATDLRSRVRSYFRSSGDTRYAARFLSSRTDDIDCIVTANALEALILEDTLLKKHKPRYNIRLKDDKTYVSIKLSVGEDFPRISVTRLVRDDGSRYFGPYASAKNVRETIKLIRKVFPLCVCSAHEFRNRVRPCLDYQMGLCSSPATGLISKENYSELVRGAILFLEGKSGEVVRMLKEKMLTASGEKKFEEAAAFRDKIRAIESMLEEQKVVSADGEDMDYVGLHRDGAMMAIDVLIVRAGRLVNKRSYVLKDAGLSGEEVVDSFLTRFYAKAENAAPSEVFVPFVPEDAPAIEQWLGNKRGRRVLISRPKRGRNKKLLDMAAENAAESLKRSIDGGKDAPLLELQTRLRLTRRPRTIEAFDISNIQGEDAVGAMVTFVDGNPDKNRYRLYKIRTVDGPDDYAMMREVLLRRYSNKELPLPDLSVMDGGKGQLAVALDVAKELGLKDVFFVSLAKDRDASVKKAKISKGERVFLPGVKDPVALNRGTKGELLLRRIRDEVHRFALSYHRKLRSKTIGSVLDAIPGVGKARRKALFDKFGDIDGIKNASIEDLMRLKGVTRELAVAIKEGIG